jgi:hypothetical protein
MRTPEQYRQNAADCHERARESENPADRQYWLQLARHWLKLAATIEQTDDG